MACSRDILRFAMERGKGIEGAVVGSAIACKGVTGL